MQMTLKVDVDTYRGTLEGVPALVELFERYDVKATFLFSMGPDHTGRALRRVFRKGFLGKVRRTSVTSHYGYKTLMYGVLLPGPHIGRKAGHVMRAAATAGHEVGIHSWDHVRWQDNVARRGEAWAKSEMSKAHGAFVETFGAEPATIGAAGWQLNRFVPALEASMGFDYASDVRGSAPFLPAMEGIESSCVQLPTTLPTLDELIGRGGITEHNVHQYVLETAAQAPPSGHVYTLHAELEGMGLLPVMDRLLARWKSDGMTIGTMGDLYRSLDPAAVPRKQIAWGEVPGRSGLLAVEGA
ncbi:MAG TPA: polysaccharide deacetylase family protein [Pseudomonadales bacterium]|nr:polysaccharide deacetylase family protein [Pseudomonadales bacterium]